MRIEGYIRTREVYVDGRLLKPERSQSVFNHSPDGFNWGYAGSGPAQLALAILLRAGLDKERAVRLHQQFKFDFVETLKQGQDFATDIDVVGWIATIEKLSC
jgi:hypothetical protein